MTLFCPLLPDLPVRSEGDVTDLADAADQRFAKRFRVLTSHIRTVPSAPAASRDPSGLKATSPTFPSPLTGGPAGLLTAMCVPQAHAAILACGEQRAAAGIGGVQRKSVHAFAMSA
jgi:hypothetical protein